MCLNICDGHNDGQPKVQWGTGLEECLLYGNEHIGCSNVKLRQEERYDFIATFVIKPLMLGL